MNTILNFNDWFKVKQTDLAKIYNKNFNGEYMIILHDFIYNKNILLANYLPTGLQKLYGFYLNFHSYLPNTLHTIVFSSDNYQIKLDKLPYLLNILQIDFNYDDKIKCNLINLNFNQLSHVFINEFYGDYITETKNYIQYDYYINSFFTRIKSDIRYLLHLRNLNI